MQTDFQMDLVRPELNLHPTDGVLRFGPVHKDAVQALQKTMEALELTMGSDEVPEVVDCGDGLACLVAGGESVVGYLHDEFGIEAEAEDLDLLVLRYCPQNTPITLSGHYHPDDGTRITTAMTAVHDGVSVRWSRLSTKSDAAGVATLVADRGHFPVVDCTPWSARQHSSDAGVSPQRRTA